MKNRILMLLVAALLFSPFLAELQAAGPASTATSTNTPPGATPKKHHKHRHHRHHRRWRHRHHRRHHRSTR